MCWSRTVIFTGQRVEFYQFPKLMCGIYNTAVPLKCVCAYFSILLFIYFCCFCIFKFVVALMNAPIHKYYTHTAIYTWTKIQFPEHANSPWPTSKTTKQKHWKVACQTGLYDDLSLQHLSTAVTGSTDHMKVDVLVIITILKKKYKQRCSPTPMLTSVNPYGLASHAEM